jgi:hypothetical protein
MCQKQMHMEKHSLRFNALLCNFHIYYASTTFRFFYWSQDLLVNKWKSLYSVEVFCIYPQDEIQMHCQLICQFALHER